MVQALCKGGASIDVDVVFPGRDDKTALWFMANYGHVGAVRELIELGADVDVQDKVGSPRAD